MLALATGIPIISIYDYFRVFFFTTSSLCIKSVHTHWSFLGGCDFCKSWKVHESTGASLAHQVLSLRHNCWAASFGSNSAEVMEDEVPTMQTTARETQGVILSKSKIKSPKHENVIKQPGNTTNTILLDMISESLQICDFSFCADSLNHCTYFGPVWGLSIDSLPAWKLVDKTMVTRGGNSIRCWWMWGLATQKLNCKTTGSIQRIVQITLVQKIGWDSKKMCDCVECLCCIGVRDLEILWHRRGSLWY